MADFPAIGHVALTVNDLRVSVPWYKKLFGLDPAMDEDTGPFHHVVFLVGSTAIGLHQFPKSTAESGEFSEFRTGLDHLAFGVGSRADLEQWQQHLEKVGIEHGGIVDAPYGSGLSFRDPDNIALEFFAFGA